MNGQFHLRRLLVYNVAMHAPSDEDLLRRFLDGDSGSFELLVRRYVQELYQFVQRFTGDRAIAEDVVQDTFLQVHDSASRFDSARKFKPWLFTIAANKARDFLRKRQRRRELPIEARIQGDDGNTQQFSDLFACDNEPIDDDLLAEERRQAVRDATSNMPDRLREILVLAYFHRMSYRDIAEVFALPVGTVKRPLTWRLSHCSENNTKRSWRSANPGEPLIPWSRKKTSGVEVGCSHPPPARESSQNAGTRQEPG